MNHVDARNSVETELTKLNLSNTHVILDKHTVETERYFIFYWTLQSVLEENEPVAGNAPFLVDRIRSRVFVTGTALSQSTYISAFLLFGDPSAAYGSTICSVAITGWRKGAETISATKRLRDTGRLTLSQSKSAVESVLIGKTFILEGFTPDQAVSLSTDLESFGFDVILGTNKTPNDAPNH